MQQRLQKAMDYMRRISQEAVAPPEGGPGPPPGAKPSQRCPIRSCWTTSPNSTASWGSPSPSPPFTSWPKPEFSPYLEAMVSQVLAQFFRQGVISSRAMLKPEPREILVRRLPSRQEAVERPPFSIY